MGVIRRGILGGFSGKVANVVGSSWKGIATLKSLPLSVANPNTAGQIAQRTKMSNIVAFAKVILVSIIKPLNDRFASGQSGFNLFVQRNISLFALINPVAPSALILSSGNVTGFDTPNMSFNIPGKTVIPDWADNTGSGNALSTDVAFIVAQNRTTGEIQSIAQDTRADAGLATGLIFEGVFVAGNVIDMWMSYRRADGTQVSDTTYQTGVVA